ncbi:MAG: acyl-CoA thioesterase II [Caulobacterales bacterium]
MPSTHKTLKDALDLERLDLNLFRGFTENKEAERIYGGQVIAQSLLAAYQTVEGRMCHSLHAYFIRPGNPRIPVIFEVDRARDGASFTTRRVIAVQNGKQIFNLAASFHIPEECFDHQSTMPAVTPPEELRDDYDVESDLYDMMPEDEKVARPQRDPNPTMEMRSVDPPRPGFSSLSREPIQRLWIRATHELPDDPIWHQVVLAYASDMSLLGTAMRPHPYTWEQIMNASLDHAIWFHRPFNVNEWMLYDMDSPSSSGARGFNRGALYTRDGVLAASVTQEGLFRKKKG